MPTSTRTLIQSTTLGAAAASVTFSSIPATYADLVVVCSNINSASGSGRSLYLVANGDTASTYFDGFASANGTTSTGSESLRTGFVVMAQAISTTSNTAAYIQVMDYTESKRKQVMTRAGHPTTAAPIVLHGYGNLPMTAAINSLQFKLDTGNMAANSTFSLYGVSAV